jgi:hypothetical protein
MRKHLQLAAAFVFLVLPGFVYAQQNQNQAGQTATDQGMSQTQSQTQTQTQTQAQTNNPGVGTMTQEQVRQTIQEQLQENMPEYSPRSEVAYQHMSQVAVTAENLVRFSERVENQGLGSQIREVARLQVESEDRVNQSIDNAQGKNSYLKFMFGPNYDELAKIKKEMEQNRLRIQEMNQILSQIQNEADRTALQSEIATMEEQNTALQEQLNELEDGFSLFGWFSRLINGY